MSLCKELRKYQLDKFSKTGLRVVLAMSIIIFISSCQKQVPSETKSTDELIKFVGDRVPDKNFFDGKLPHAMGIHHYQVYRANRSESIENDKVGWTYNHQPFLAYWKDNFYVQYLSNVVQEHDPPGKTQIVKSKDGRHWDKPIVVFPEYTLPEIDYEGLHVDAGMKSVMHQRMGFYVSPDGKLLTSAFYGYSSTPRNSPNAGNGLGRVIREIKEDGSLGPIYFIRYNRHAGWNESNTNFPFYKTSKDAEFLEACKSLLADKLITLQWWEEDRSDDGFYLLNPGDVPGSAAFSATISTSKGSGKAFNYFHRKDGAIIGLWKNKYSSLSKDNGKTWSKISRNESLLTDGAKTWAQKTKDDKYVVIHNQSATSRNRYPMTSMTSSGGEIFSDLLSLRNDIPTVRYQALHKNPGSQYYRGIIEGNGNPPGDDAWVVYSLNKEDIWVAKMTLPIIGVEDNEVNQNFNSVNDVMELDKWNIYEPKWAQIKIVNDPLDNSNNYLELRDEEPIDYARVERVLKERKKFLLSFRVNPIEIPTGYAVNIEVQDKKGVRPMRIRFDKKWISFDQRYAQAPKPIPTKLKEWHLFNLSFNCEKQSYSLKINGKTISENIPFAFNMESLQRLVIRTGPYRGEVPPNFFNIYDTDTPGLGFEDIPGTEEKIKASIFLIDDIKTKEE